MRETIRERGREKEREITSRQKRERDIKRDREMGKKEGGVRKDRNPMKFK